MELRTLKATTRQTVGKEAAGKTRKGGAIPAVLYGGGEPPLSLTVDARQFELLIHHGRSGEHAIVQLDVEDNPAINTPALVKAVQHHPMRGSAVHADFLRIRLDQRITTVVPIRLVGQAPGIIEGGVMDLQLREVEVECLALEVPESIDVDVSELHLNDSFHVAQLKAPEGLAILSDPERTVVAVHTPRVVKETTAVAAEAVEGEATTPEVVGEKKDKGEEKEKDKDKEKKK